MDFFSLELLLVTSGQEFGCEIFITKTTIFIAWSFIRELKIISQTEINSTLNFSKVLGLFLLTKFFIRKKGEFKIR